MAEQTNPSEQDILAMAIAQINIGIAMARAKGVVCGSPTGIRIVKAKS
jgi:hypothetical protein